MICPHGQLARQCEQCEVEGSHVLFVAELKKLAKQWEQPDFGRPSGPDAYRQGHRDGAEFAAMSLRAFIRNRGAP